MPAPIIDISMLGDKSLERKLSKLVGRVQKKVVRSAMRKGMKNIKKAVVAAVPVDTGKLKAAMSKQKVKSLKRSRSKSGLVIGFPTREELDIPADAKHFFPASVEFGRQGVPPQSYIRKPTDAYWEGGGKYRMARDIAKGIEKEAAKK